MNLANAGGRERTAIGLLLLPILHVASVFFEISGHLRLLFEKGEKSMRISFFLPLLTALQISWGTQSLTSVDSHTLSGTEGKSTLE